MVRKIMLLKLSKRLSELCEEHGVSSNLAVVNYMDNECDVEIPRDLANERAEAIGKICDALRKVPGVASIYDNGAGTVIGKGKVRRFEILVDDSEWHSTEEDEFVADREMRALFDKKFAAEEKAKQLEEKLKNWKEYIIPIPKPDKNPSEIVYLVLAYEPFDWIKSGEKKKEYRCYTERYLKRLVANRPKRVLFQRGYGGPGRSKPEQMEWTIKNVSLHDIQHGVSTDPMKPDPIVPTHIVIELGDRVK